MVEIWLNCGSTLYPICLFLLVCLLSKGVRLKQIMLFMVTDNESYCYGIWLKFKLLQQMFGQ